ncbi:MAG TPA: hypothetical protein VNT79_00195, partial [Phycisphaerae bacterium]|nr:hypothetical protein [Phycisphaerae bacterium]
MKNRLLRIGLIFVFLTAVARTLTSASADPKKPVRDKSKKLLSANNPDRRALVNWPSFRGPGASGVANRCRPPRKWNVETGENVRWKTPIPGLGHSCPVIWGDRLIITTAISGKDDAGLRVGLYGDIAPVEDDTEHEFRVICLDKNSGKILWNKLAHKAVPKIKRHTKATHANSTPATDGKHVVAF